MGTPADLHTLGVFDISGALALELASQLTPPTEVFARHGISEDDAKVLLANTKFQQLLRQAKAEWSAESNTADRIRLKAQMALEQLLLPMFNTAVNPQIPVQARNDTIKIIERLSGVTAKEESSGSAGPMFKLTINLGDAQPRQIEGTVVDAE